MGLAVKICGLTEAWAVEQACEQGAAYVGFVLYPPSPRSLEPRALHDLVPLAGQVTTVGVMVDPDDAWIETVLAAAPLDVLQLHGREKPARVEAIGTRFGVRTMKAVRVEAADDLAGLDELADAADLLLFDAKPPRDAAWPGGHGLPFDWTLLQGLAVAKPWALAGGLTAENLAAAVDRVRPPIVDTSSGVETAPGRKDKDKLAAFLREARRLGAAREVALEETR